MADDDLALYERWCAGERAAGNALFDRHFQAIYRFFKHKVEAEAADELVQETFLACTRSRDAFRRASSFRTFLYGIARNQLLHHWRGRAVRGDAIDFEEVSIASLSTTIGTRLARGQERARLLDALTALPLEQQLLLELHYWEDLGAEQLAEVFAIEPATARTRLHRARAALREHLGTDEPGPRPDDD